MAKLSSLAFVLVLVCSLHTPAKAHACEVVSTCKGGVRPDAETPWPANWSMMAWKPCIGDPSTIPPRLSVRTASGEIFEVTTDLSRPMVSSESPLSGIAGIVTWSLDFWMIRIHSQLRPGDTLLLSYEGTSGTDAEPQRVELSWPVVEPVELPERLGVLDAEVITGMTRGSSRAGECARELLASYADVTLELSDAARPFESMLRYELRIDGDQPWIYFTDLAMAYSEPFGSGGLGRGHDRVIVSCEDTAYEPALLPGLRFPPKLEPGKHRVRMVGLLPDGTELSSDEVELEFSCPKQTSERAGAATSATPAEPEPAADGGGCALAGTRPTPADAMLLLLALAALLRRRR